MQFIIDGSYNELILPEGWSCAMTGNPPDGEYNVLELDPAQSSRMLVMAYNRPNEAFYEQCERQDVDTDMKNFWMSHKELVTQPPCQLNPPADNDRTKMIWNRVYPYLKHDPAVMRLVGTTMFGAGFVAALLASLESDRPIDPADVLYNWEAVEATAKRYANERRTDLLTATVLRLCAFFDTREPTDVDLDAYRNLCFFGEILPESDAHNLFTRLTGTGDRGKLFSKQLQDALRGSGSNFAMKSRTLIMEVHRKLGTV